MLQEWEKHWKVKRNEVLQKEADKQQPVSLEKHISINSLSVADPDWVEDALPPQ